MAKREIVKFTPFYDFLYCNEISLQNEYWEDPYHGDIELGNLLIKNLLFNKTLSYGIYVTKNNIEDVLKTEKEYLKKYIKDNKEDIDKFQKISDN